MEQQNTTPAIEAYEVTVAETELEVDEEQSEKLTTDHIQEFLETEDGQTFLQNRFESEREIWLESNLDDLIAEARRKQNDPKEIQIRNLQLQLERESRIDQVSQSIQQHRRLLPLQLSNILADFDQEKSDMIIQTLVRNINKTMADLVRHEVDTRLNRRSGK